jgi:hypothetical protein
MLLPPSGLIIGAPLGVSVLLWRCLANRIRCALRIARPPDLAAGFFLRCRNYPRWQGTSFIVATMSELFRSEFSRAAECHRTKSHPSPQLPIQSLPFQSPVFENSAAALSSHNE